MIEAVLTFFRGRMALTDEHAELIRSLMVQKTLRKGEFVQRAGEPARHGHFVAQGCLRSFSIDEKGREHILQFAPEGWWLTDFASIRTGEPSAFFIDAIEDSGVLLVDWPSHDQMIERIPGFATAFATGLQKQASAREQRIITTLSGTAEERYLRFLETYRQVAQRIPQRMLASYLGMTPETLSRVRRQITKKQRP